MKRRGKFIAVAVVAVLLGGILTLEIISRRPFTVMMTDTGYEPSRITIQPGQKVIWKNSGQTERWPASNSHPTHQDYPSDTKSCLGSQLDACRALKTGEQYEFTFEKTGAWGMHDHLSPNDGMVVTVSRYGRGWLGRIRLMIDGMRNRNVSTEKMNAGTFRSLDYAAQQTTLEQLAQKDAGAAWELLKEAFIINGQVTQDVHEFAHLIGHAAYEKQGIAGVSICDASFAYGCFHGVAEEAIQTQGEDAVVDIELACTEELDEQRRPSCYHGIGHGTAGIHKLTLKPALEACDRMQEANSQYCYDGVFMEHANSLGSTAIEKDAPWALCEGLDARYHVSCARYQPNRLNGLGLDFTQGIKTCAKTSFEQLHTHCARAYGFAAASQGQHEASGIGTLCSSSGDQRTADWCRIAAASELVFQAYSGWETAAPEVCQQITTETYKAECISSVEYIRNGEGR